MVPNMAQPIRREDCEPSPDDLDVVFTGMSFDNPEHQARVNASRREQAADMRRTGRIPTVAEYRKVYENLHRRHGLPPPSDAEIRAMHLVAE